MHLYYNQFHPLTLSTPTPQHTHPPHTTTTSALRFKHREKAYTNFVLDDPDVWKDPKAKGKGFTMQGQGEGNQVCACCMLGGDGRPAA
jgi:hypothetical protein